MIDSPLDICDAAKLYFTTDCCLSVIQQWYTQIPPEDTFFDIMPMAIIAFPVEETISVENLDLGDKVTLPPLQIAIYVEIEDGDVGGLIADRLINRLWWCLVRRLNGFRYFDKTVDGSRMISGGISGFPDETEEIGIKIRWAWVQVECWIHL